MNVRAIPSVEAWTRDGLRHEVSNVEDHRGWVMWSLSRGEVQIASGRAPHALAKACVEAVGATMRGAR